MHKNYFVLCRIAQNSDYALCQIADDQHNISANSKRFRIYFRACIRGLGMLIDEENSGPKSRDTVPLNFSCHEWKIWYCTYILWQVFLNVPYVHNSSTEHLEHLPEFAFRFKQNLRNAHDLQYIFRLFPANFRFTLCYCIFRFCVAQISSVSLRRNMRKIALFRFSAKMILLHFRFKQNHVGDQD
jgi:hypothetical protein